MVIAHNIGDYKTSVICILLIQRLNTFQDDCWVTMVKKLIKMNPDSKPPQQYCLYEVDWI